jgi:hypothetical protein
MYLYQVSSKDGTMDTGKQNTANRKGQFLWMEPSARTSYLQTLKKKISDGFYYSESVLSKVAEDLTPILEEVATNS